MILIILGILTAASLPALQDFMQSHKSTLIQMQLLQVINYAQETARVRRLPISLCATNNQATCQGEWQDGQLIFIDEKKEGIVRNKRQIIQFLQAVISSGKVHFRAYPAYRQYLLFLPTGFSHENGSFWYCQQINSQANWAIILNQAGRARLQYPDQRGEIKDTNGQRLLC